MAYCPKVSSSRLRLVLLATLMLYAPASSSQEARYSPAASPADVRQPKLARGSETHSVGRTAASQIAIPINAHNDTANATDRNIAAKMINAERVNVRVPGYAALSGEYRINGDGTMSLPGIGRIEVGELTVSEFEQQLASEIARISNRDVSVAIEVVDYRPIFISGAVARSGSFPWKPGLTVLHAEALAGGLFRGTVVGDAMTLSPTTDRERERAVRSAYDLAATLAQIERLQVERNNGNTLTMPARVSDLISTAERDALFAAQQAALKSRTQAFTNRVAAAQNSRTLAIKEKTALEQQRTRILDQLVKRRALLGKVEVMTGLGYSRGDRLFDEQVRLAELEERLTNVTLAISRIEIAAAAAEKEADSLLLGRKADIDAELVALKQRSAQLEIEIESANGAYQRATGRDAIASRAPEPMTPSYELVRVVGGKSTIIAADRSSLLQPNDVLVVNFSRKPPATR